MSSRGTLGTIVGFVASALSRLADDLADTESALGLLADIGVIVDELPAGVLALGAKAETVRSDHDALLASSDEDELPAALALSASLVELTAALVALGPELIAELDATPEQPARADAGQRLLDRLLFDTAAAELPTLHATLRLGGIFHAGDDPTPPPAGSVATPEYPTGLEDWITLDPPADPDDYARPVPDWDEPGLDVPVSRRRTLRTDRLRTLLDDPAALLDDVFAWGSPEFRGVGVLRRLLELLNAAGLAASLGARADLEAAGSSGGRDAEATPQAPVLDVRAYSAAAEHGTIDVGAALAPLPPTTIAGADGGISLALHAEGAAELAFPLSEATELVLGGDMDLSGNVRVAFRPGGARLELDPFGSGDGRLSGAPSATLRHAPVAGVTLLAQSGLATVSVDALALTLELMGAEGGLVPSVGLALEGGRLELGAAGADSFLRSVIPSTSASFDAGLEWTDATGFRLSAGAGLVVVISLETDLGPVHLYSLALAIEGEGSDGLLLTATLRAGITLGPILGTVEGIGLGLAVRVAEEGGNLGPLHVDPLRFVPPTGLGLAIEAEGVSGGGFLTHDPDIGRYAGAAELDFYGTGLVAVGIVTTQMPDGGEGWSMFLTLGIRFVGVQLGFGFTLNGVGGLVGINRGLDDDALGDAVRSGSLDAILFPENPLEDAMQILADIDSVFPAAQGQYVFGPVVKIGWPSPTLVEIDLGVALQLPDPLSVSLLGALSAILPTEDAPVLELHAGFAGTLDITEGTLKLDASLSGSQVAGLEITGDMAVRADFLGEPSFLVAFGGFHPDFDAPADFPALEGVGVALDTGDALRITLGGYFALTSNTVQFGSHAELWAKAVGFTAEGGTTFDALITFKPFGFDIALKAWVSITAGGTELLGVLLEGRLTGPNPWRAFGGAEFRLLGFKARLEIEATFGQRSTESPPTSVDVGALLLEELALEDAWSALPPVSAVPVVVSDASGELAVDPSGRVQVVQRVVPLERTIEQYGNAQLDGPDSFTLTALGFAAEDVEDVEDWFASAQFFRIEEDEKLSTPSFTSMKAGLVLGGSGVDAPVPSELTYDHEVFYRDPNGAARNPKTQPFIATDAAMTRALATRSSPTATTRFSVAEPRYVIADGETGAAAADGLDFFAARAALTDDGDQVLVPAYELELVP